MKARADRHGSSTLLPDGRRLSYRESGDPRGQALFYFHGLPGSRSQCPDDGSARDLGVRLIAPERPGFGQSDPVAGPYSLGAWTRDVAALADFLGVGHFSIVGYSLGGMHALACAWHMPERVRRVGLVSSFAPLEFPENWEGLGGIRAFYALAQNDPVGLRQAAEPLLADPERFLAVLADNACEVDRRQFAGRELHQRFVHDACETIRGGIESLQRDVVLCARPWGFNVQDIKTPVLLWHGLDDVNAAPAMARYLAAKLRDCTARYFPGEGHLLLFNRWPEIIEALAR